MLLRVAKEAVRDYLVEAQASWKRVVENYKLENPMLEPTVNLQAGGEWLEFSLSYIVDYTKRTIVKDRLFTKIVDAVASSDGRLKWASSSTPAVSPPADFHVAANLASTTGGRAR
jgi:hypothetical protein